MLRIVTVPLTSISSADRFEPEYWVIKDFIDDLLAQHDHQKISEFSKFIRKGIFDLKAEKYQSYGVPFLRISNLKYFELGTEDLVYISDTDNKENYKTVLRHGDIAFSKIGTLGKLLRIGKRFPEVNISQNLIGLGFKKDTDKNYLFAYLISKLSLLQIKKNKKKQLQDKLNLSDIRDLEVVKLPKDKEEKISRLVESAENYAEKSLALISSAKKVFYDELGIDFSKIQREKFFSTNLSSFHTGGLWNPSFSLPLYKNVLSVIETNCETCFLGALVSIKKGDEVGSDNYNKYLDKKPSDIPFIRTSDIVNYEVDQFPDYYVSKEVFEELAQDLEPGDILYNNDGKIGLVSMLTNADQVIIQSHIRRLRIKSEAAKLGVTSEYLFLVLCLPEISMFQANRYTVIQSTIPTISNNLSKFVIPIISREKILEISKIVKKAYQMKARKKLIIKKVRNYIDNYFEL